MIKWILICFSDGDSAIEAKAMLQDAQLHLEELQNKLNRTQPMINLVDNMVKLGSLYAGVPADSHMSKVKINNCQKEMLGMYKVDWNGFSLNKFGIHLHLAFLL